MVGPCSLMEGESLCAAGATTGKVESVAAGIILSGGLAVDYCCVRGRVS